MQERIKRSFKPFQGFLPVSTISSISSFEKCRKVSNPSRASYRFLLNHHHRILEILYDVSNPSRASYRFLPPSHLFAEEVAKVCFKPFQGFLPVSTNSLRSLYRHGLTMFQTLPGLLTGFYLIFVFDSFLCRLSFKPFQGFLPVSTSDCFIIEKKMLYSFKPFQGFLPVSTK
ncbi:hypothetical protein U14_02611 [Candidatus Moduliflexus flocculans]|uniref:Uncharacterized protein n=1 Tax=Candidatus Moduliflexus flocculans TaxID=1499966 RepID=A0A081BLV2_9BACT|nr:hypothetical protein U14_02611 [Candidatus Moduliflexus flocculans]